jgi:hypothetical protein
MGHHTLGTWTKMKFRNQQRQADQTMRLFLLGIALDAMDVAITILSRLAR